MELKKELIDSAISVNQHLSSKEEVLRQISVLAKTSPVLEEYQSEDIFWALSEREELSSTGFGKGIAIPHCTLDCSEFVIGALTIPEGVEFDAIDNQPVKIVVFIIAPQKQRDRHIRYLSALSGMLNNELNQTKLLAAKSAEALKGIFLRHTELPDHLNSSSGWNQISYIIQSEDILDRVLGILTEVDDTNITVLDANTAGYFLYSKPLFSSLWGDTVNNFCKLIIATVPRKLANEILRRTNQLIKDEFPEGLIVTSQEINYLAGKLNI